MCNVLNLNRFLGEQFAVNIGLIIFKLLLFVVISSKKSYDLVEIFGFHVAWHRLNHAEAFV